MGSNPGHLLKSFLLYYFLLKSHSSYCVSSYSRKMQSWEKERQISKESPSSPILPNRNVPPQSSPHDLMAKSNFPPDFKKKYEQWQKIKDEPTASGGAAANIQAGPWMMWVLSNAGHHNPRFFYFLPTFWSPKTFFQGAFFFKFWPYVRLVFKRGL